MKDLLAEVEYYRRRSIEMANMVVSCASVADDLEVPFEELSHAASVAQAYIDAESSKVKHNDT